MPCADHIFKLRDTFPRFAPCTLLQSRFDYRAPARRIPAEPSDAFGKGVFTATPARMGVSYAYDLASTLYNDAEQRPSLVKKGLTRAGIEKV